MQDYAKLIAKWPSVAGATTQAKLDSLNANPGPHAMPDPAGAKKAILHPSDVLNAITPTDLAGLTTAQVQVLILLLQGSTIDASAGTTIRIAAQALFAGKTTTLSNLGALVAPFDNPTVAWWKANGYSSPISSTDLDAAGNLA